MYRDTAPPFSPTSTTLANMWATLSPALTTKYGRPSSVTAAFALTA